MYDGGRDLPRWLESVETFATSVIALDDGSTDGTAEILTEHPLVETVLRNPPRSTHEDWDDRINRQRLIEAASATSADWLLFLDADEAIDESDGVELRRFLNNDALKTFAYGFEIFRMVGDESTYDPNGLWVYRLFALREKMAELPNRRLHFVPIPADIPRKRWLRTTVRIQHYGSLTEARRQERFSKYLSADPFGAFQDDYTDLLEPPTQMEEWKPRPDGLPVVIGASSLYRRPNSTLKEADRVAISVVVIAQNDEAVIERSLRAIQSQDIPDDFEVIVVGSGSDETIETARRIAPTARCVQLSHPVLPGEARNVGLWMARGEFITFPGSHVWLTPSSLRIRLAAHDDGWELVTGGVHNGNETDSGWASYFLDHSAQIPERPSGQLGGPPGHASYNWRDVWAIGGFPEHMRAGEDTVVNNALHSAGRRTFFEAGASFYHASPCQTPSDVIRHHRKRGIALGQIISSRSARPRVSLPKAVGTAWRITLRRISVIDSSIREWGAGYAREYRRARLQIILGAVSAGLGAVAGMVRARNEVLRTNQEDDGAQHPWQKWGGLAIAGRPDVPEFGLLGAGPAEMAVHRLEALVSHIDHPVAGALCLTVTAETLTPGRDRSFADHLDEEVISQYRGAAEKAGFWLILQVQHQYGGVLDAVRRWAQWFEFANVGVLLDADSDTADHRDDIADAVGFLERLTEAKRIPSKPILVSGYETVPHGVQQAEIIELHQVADLPTKVDTAEWVVLA